MQEWNANVGHSSEADADTDALKQDRGIRSLWSVPWTARPGSGSTVEARGMCIYNVWLSDYWGMNLGMNALGGSADCVPSMPHSKPIGEGNNRVLDPFSFESRSPGARSDLKLYAGEKLKRSSASVGE